MDVPGESIQLGIHQRGLLPATQFDGPQQLAPVSGRLPDSTSVNSAIREVEPRAEPRNRLRLPLCCESEPALALALGRNAVVRDELGVLGGHLKPVCSSKRPFQ